MPEPGGPPPAGDGLGSIAARLGISRPSPYHDMLLDFIERDAERLAMQCRLPASRDEWQAGRDELRRRFQRALGLTPFPERTELNARVTGTVERPAYRIEKVVYEPRPGFTATAHLYLPRGRRGPSPAVLYSPGHWMENGKLEPDIQICCANLARLGFVVLVYDPIGQGERLGTWRDHGHLELLLAGQTQAGLMAWESVRAIDYLLSRPEVDPARLGMSGASGGGLNTFCTCAIDDRIQVSVPVCFINTFLDMMKAQRNRNWEDGVDLCNQIPGVMSLASMAGICGVFAPKPLCVIAGVQDHMFPIAGVRAAYREVQHLYALAGEPGRCRLVEVDSGHGYDRQMREAAYGWLAHWLLGEGDASPIEEQEAELVQPPYHAAQTYLAPPDAGDLGLMRKLGYAPRPSPGWCFPDGIAPPVGPALTRLAGSHVDAAFSRSGALSAAELDSPSSSLQTRLQGVLGPWPTNGPLRERLLNQVQYESIFAERVIFESETGIEVPAMFLAPQSWTRHVPVVIYLDEYGKEAGFDNGIFNALLQAGLAVFAVDVRGTGETAASDFEATTNALMTDRPLFGQRLWDLRRAIDCLWNRVFISVQIDKGQIGCIGKGAAGVLALFAAALDDRLAAAVVWRAPVSFQSLILEEVSFPPSLFLFDVLRDFDLPQLACRIAPRPLLLAEPVDGARRPIEYQAAHELYHPTSDAYSLFQAPVDQFRVAAGAGFSGPDGIAQWLQRHLTQ